MNWLRSDNYRERNDALPNSCGSLDEWLDFSSDLPEMEWTPAYLPVVAVVQGLDPANKQYAEVGTRLLKRVDLAARYGVDPHFAIGEQLSARGVISNDKARLIDGELFRRRLLCLKVRIDNVVDSVPELLSDLQTYGLIDKVIGRERSSDYLFLRVLTRRFADLARILSVRTGDMAALLSVNDNILYV